MWNYLRGYVIIIVEGYFIEKFFNICTHRQILLWDIRRHKNNLVTMRVSVKGFKLLRPVARKTKCRVRIVKKRGLPFLSNRYRKRKAFFAGAFLFILLMYIMTSFIWSVEITGNKELESGYVEKALAENGIRPGVLKYGIDTKKAVAGLMTDIRELAWVSIDVRGTKVKVQLKERKPLPQMVAKDEPCNIVALKDGMIKQIIVTDGIEAVAEGDTVKKGQVLISGSIPVKNEKDAYRLVHAMGTVKARTWYETRCPVRLEEVEKVRTGNVMKNYSLVLFAKRLELFHKRVGYEDYDYVEVKQKLMIGEDLVFPFELVTDSFYENRLVKVKVSEDEAQKTASDTAWKAAMEEMPPDTPIIRSEVKIVEDEELGPVAKVTVECLEEIGTEQAIGGN
jgi:similar to stage IV sporulation protein